MANIKGYQKDGKRFYKFQIYIGTDPLTGKRLKTTRSGFATKKEAQLALSRLQLEIERGDFRKKSVDTFNDIYLLWVEQYKNTVEASTFVKTTGIFKNHILPSLGDYKIEKVNVQTCQKHVNEWFNKLQKYRTVKSYASKVFDYAVTLGIVTDNDGLNNKNVREFARLYDQVLIKKYSWNLYHIWMASWFLNNEAERTKLIDIVKQKLTI